MAQKHKVKLNTFITSASSFGHLYNPEERDPW